MPPLVLLPCARLWDHPLSLIDSTYLRMYNEIMSVSRLNLGSHENPLGGSDQGLYPISVITERTGISAHTLRSYERAGLLAPLRTDRGTRRYSDDDVARLRRIVALSDDRVNLAGIRRIMELEAELAQLRAEIGSLRRAADG